MGRTLFLINTIYCPSGGPIQQQEWSAFAVSQDIRTIQELLGPKDVKTTMIYTHGLRGAR